MAGFVFYSIIFSFLFVATVLLLTRHQWLPRIFEVVYMRIPSSFMGDVEDGFTSNDFNLSDNIVTGDARGGLDEAGKREVKKIMKKQKLGFDEARKVYTERRFAKNNIGPEGIPRDPKFVSFS